MNIRPLTIYLLIAGITMLMVGAYIALTPIDYVSTMNPSHFLDTRHELTPSAAISIDMLSDLRGMGGMLMFVGVFAIGSVFKPALKRNALITSTLVFSAYVALRSVGFLFDGIPSAPILVAYCIELIFVLFGMRLLVKEKATSKQHVSLSSGLFNN